MSGAGQCATCHRCGGYLHFDTDEIGRLREHCDRCHAMRQTFTRTPMPATPTTTRLAPSQLAAFILRDREARGMAWVAYAEFLGVTPKSIRQWEDGGIPRGRTKDALRERLGVVLISQDGAVDTDREITVPVVRAAPRPGTSVAPRVATAVVETPADDCDLPALRAAALAIDVANAYALVRADLEHRGSAIATALQAIGAVVSFGV